MRISLILLFMSIWFLGACNDTCHEGEALNVQKHLEVLSVEADKCPEASPEASSSENMQNGGKDASLQNSGVEPQDSPDTTDEALSNNEDSSKETAENNNNDSSENSGANISDGGNGEPEEGTEEKEEPHQGTVSIEMPGLSNLYRVSEKLYRSAQPAQNGLISAQELGIGTVLSLQLVNMDVGLDEASEVSLEFVHVPMIPSIVSDEDVLKALRVIRSSEGPVLVHCLHGADRTGTVVAMYRIVFQNWSKEKAIDEMTNGGFGYHPEYANLLELIEQADIEAYRRALEL